MSYSSSFKPPFPPPSNPPTHPPTLSIQVVNLFTYLTDKDLFAEIYRNQLAKRLLNARYVPPTHPPNPALYSRAHYVSHPPPPMDYSSSFQPPSPPLPTYKLTHPPTHPPKQFLFG